MYMALNGLKKKGNNNSTAMERHSENKTNDRVSKDVREEKKLI